MANLIQRRGNPEEETKVDFTQQWVDRIRQKNQEVREASEVNIPAPKKRAPVVEEEPEPEKEEIEIEDPVERISPVDGPTWMGEGSDIMSIMDATEGAGNYDTLFQHAQNGPFSGVNVSDMTLGQLVDFSDVNGKYGQWVKDQIGRVSTPMGRYQFVGTTLKAVANKMGLSMDTKFSPRVQDAMFNFHLQETIRGKSPEQQVEALRGQWEGFKNVPGERLINAVRSA